MDQHSKSRREFIKEVSLVTGGLALLPALSSCSGSPPGSKMKLGLVTYNWGREWDIPTIIENCTAAGVYGVELRVDHAHGVHPGMSAAEREEVKNTFDNSEVEIVGMGTNEDYHHADPAVLRERMENTRAWLHLSQDIGGTGVKVKPNAFPEGIPRQKTIEQIGESLQTLGEYAADLDQMIRLEVHGRGTDELPVVKAIMDYVTSPHVGVCWNCNDTDLEGQGLEYNFNLVKDRFGDTVHIRELNVGEYPYQQLMNLLVGMDYEGWILMENREKIEDGIAAMKEQKEIFQQMIENARISMG